MKILASTICVIGLTIACTSCSSIGFEAEVSQLNSKSYRKQVLHQAHELVSQSVENDSLKGVVSYVVTVQSPVYVPTSEGQRTSAVDDDIIAVVYSSEVESQPETMFLFSRNENSLAYLGAQSMNCDSLIKSVLFGLDDSQDVLRLGEFEMVVLSENSYRVQCMHRHCGSIEVNIKPTYLLSNLIQALVVLMR